MTLMQSRRDFVATLSLAGAAGAARQPRRRCADEGPPETTTIRLPQGSGICVAPALRRRGAAARRGLHRRPLSWKRDGKRRPVGVDRTRRDGLRA